MPPATDRLAIARRLRDARRMRPRVLCVVSSRPRYERVDRATGLWLGEYVHFYDQLRDACDIDVVSPLGGDVPLDPESLKGLAVDAPIRAFRDDPGQMAQLKGVRRTADARAADYAAIYYAGGHGAMWDFPGDPSLQALARQIWDAGGIVAAVCHGVAGLIDLELTDGKYLVDGKKVTGYSDREEVVGRTRKLVPFSLEERLRARGAHYSRSFVPFVSNTVSDGRLLTGQNPFSTRALAKLLKTKLAGG
jgi:putative intracellular protease/amidase